MTRFESNMMSKRRAKIYISGHGTKADGRNAFTFVHIYSNETVYFSLYLVFSALFFQELNCLRWVANHVGGFVVLKF